MSTAYTNEYSVYYRTRTNPVNWLEAGGRRAGDEREKGRNAALQVSQLK